MDKFCFAVRVTPNAKHETINPHYDMFGFVHLCVKVTVPPEDGKANKAVIKLLSDYFKIAKSCFMIEKGLQNRDKIIAISADNQSITRCKILLEPH